MLAERLKPWLSRLQVRGSFIRPESRIAISCADYLREHAPIDLLWYHTPNEGQRGFVAWEFLAAEGFLPGLADLVMARRRPGGLQQVVHVEFKAKGRYMGPVQRETAGICALAGIPTYVVRSLEEFIVVLEQTKLLR